MRYYKYIDQNGFVSLSTLNANGDGNITQEEYNTILTMIRSSEEGYGVIETENGYEYALVPVEPEPDISEEELFEILFGEE